MLKGAVHLIVLFVKNQKSDLISVKACGLELTTEICTVSRIDLFSETTQPIYNIVHIYRRPSRPKEAGV